MRESVVALKNINSHIQLPNLILKHFRDETDDTKKVWYLDISSGKISNLRHLNLEHQKDIILGGENCSGTERLKIRWESSPIRSAVFLMKK